MIELLLVIPLTIILGRFFCGWMCAFGTLGDLIYKIPKGKLKKKLKINEKLDSILKKLKFLILAVIFILIITNSGIHISLYSPWDAFAMLPNVNDAISFYLFGFIILLIIVVSSFFIERFFCCYLCPLGAIFSLFSKTKLLYLSKPKEKCGKCRICTDNCSMHIPLYKKSVIKSGECNNCNKCIKVCPRNNVSLKFAGSKLKPVLISTILASFIIIVYAVVLKLPVYLDNKTVETINNIVMSSNIAQDNSNNSLSNSSDNSSNIDNNSVSSSVPNSNTISSQFASSSSVSSKVSSSQLYKYKNGTFYGIATGYRPGFKVSITILNDKLTSVVVLANNDTPSYANEPIKIIPQEIVTAQSTNVDVVSGATRTSNGIIQAVKNALNTALV